MVELSRELPQRILELPMTQKIAYTAGGMPEYIGETAPGTAVTAKLWRIKKLTYSGTNVTDIKWASGTATYDKYWDNGAGTTYAGYTYS